MEFHGGNIYEHEEKMIDFSSNINPLGVPKSFEKSIIDNINKFSVYPDIQYREMRNNIISYLGVKSIDNIVPGNGAVDIIYRALENIGYKKLFITKPTFAEYKKAGEDSLMMVKEIDCYDEEYEKIDWEKVDEQLEEKSVLLMCNPNNPTGTLITKSEFLKVLDYLKSIKSFLIIDEAFIEFALDFKDASMVEYIEKYDNLLIIRAATKFFGMPGIRLGYGVSGNIKLIEKIRNSMEPWSINTSAEIAASCIFEDKEYIKETLNWIRIERDYFYNELSKIDCIKVYKSNSNFFFIKLLRNEIDAYKLQEQLLKYKLLIRVPRGFSGVTDYDFRIAIKDRDSNDKLLYALKKVFKEDN